jgi:hypothetical protein
LREWHDCVTVHRFSENSSYWAVSAPPKYSGEKVFFRSVRDNPIGFNRRDVARQRTVFEQPFQKTEWLDALEVVIVGAQLTRSATHGRPFFRASERATRCDVFGRELLTLADGLMRSIATIPAFTAEDHHPICGSGKQTR